MIGAINWGFFMKGIKCASNHFESGHFMKNIKEETTLLKIRLILMKSRKYMKLTNKENKYYIYLM